jgi:C-terminal processing protease CtpA/Prc
MYATGVFDWLPDGALADVGARAELYSPFGRDVPTGVWTGPLYVLVDRRSASATEALVAMLKDNGAATVIGERTFGAGCGYMDGGLPIELPHSGWVVRMPDCARFRIDGTNEIEGIEPDVPLPWTELGGAERARALVEALALTPRGR